MVTTEQAPTLDRRITISYALGSVGTAGFSTVPGLLLAYYLTNSLGVAAGVAALVLLVPKLWDVVFLPIVGNLSDRSVSVRHTRRPFLLAGGLLLPVLFALMFAVPSGFAPTAAAVWVFLAFTAAASAFAIFQVPYIATPAEITDSPGARTTLMAWRVAFLTFGILLFGAGSPALRDAFADQRTGYLVMGVVVGALIGLGMLACWWGLRRARILHAEESERSLRAQFDVARRNRDFTALLGTFVLQALATSSMLGGAQYFATYILERESIADVLFVCLVGPGILFVPVWAKLSHRLGKKRGYLIASLTFTAGALLLLGSRVLPVAVVLALVAVCGVGYAGMQMFPLSMLPDTIAADAAARGKQQAGAFTGYWTAGETAGFAVGPALVLSVLAITGFVSSTADVQVSQPGSAVTGVLLAFTVLPTVLTLLSLLLLRRYRLNPSEATVGPSLPTLETS
ncbi:MAG: glycoside/pentoside/hexuronide:cation symporter, family [Actinomycetota bacterium]|nr:glycoside/pentoside/hexuronide:cation symporter, family [Actinomycetota bacterium]